MHCSWLEMYLSVQMRESAKKIGDLGTAAEQRRSKQKTMFTPKPLTVEGVLKQLRMMAALTGKSSQNKRKGLIQELLVRCKGIEVWM